jgi:hypothetical protein
MITIEPFPPKRVKVTRMITGRVFIRVFGNKLGIPSQIAYDKPINPIATKWAIGLKVIRG